MTVTVSRRDINKSRTRASIITALRDLLDESPLGGITAERVADQAGVSRRTFFNYFPNVASVVSAAFAQYTTSMVAALPPYAPGGSPVEALRSVVRQGGIPTPLVDWIWAVGSVDTSVHEHAATAVHQQVWAEQEQWLHTALRNWLPEPADELYLRITAATLMSAFAAAAQEWCAPRQHRRPLTERDVREFHARAETALGHLADGLALHLTAGAGRG